MGVWAVEGGAATPEDARAALYKATNGGRGVALPGDLLVRALPVPGTSVRVNPGGASLPSRYSGGAGESYGTLLKATEDVPVPATGSASGATRYLIQRITDPQFEGQPPADPITARYDSFVWVDSLDNLPYPFVELARLDQPASTATITQSMLTDIRRLARPRSQQYVVMGAPTPNVDLVSSTGAVWPTGYAPMVYVPEWATHVSIVATLASIGHLNGSVAGILAATVADGEMQFRSSNTVYDLDSLVTAGQRHTLLVGGYGAINPGLRGINVRLGTEASRTEGPGYLTTRDGSHIVYQVTFTEEVV